MNKDSPMSAISPHKTPAIIRSVRRFLGFGLSMTVIVGTAYLAGVVWRTWYPPPNTAKSGSSAALSAKPADKPIAAPHPTDGDNLAQGKRATQSSTAAPASNAVDGNTDGNFSAGSVAHTGLDRNAWWQVDLGATARIEGIEIWNRTDGGGERLNDYWIFVSNKAFDPRDTPEQLEPRRAIWGSHQTITPNPSASIPLQDVRGRYVRVQLAGENYLCLAEVRVIGTWVR
jgi:hypothetical protein